MGVSDPSPHQKALAEQQGGPSWGGLSQVGGGGGGGCSWRGFAACAQAELISRLKAEVKSALLC